MRHTRDLIAAMLTWVACVQPAFAESATLFRVFLNDGTTVVSYGEYARVGDRLIFSMPIGSVDLQGGVPNLHVVNLPLSTVNWTVTASYADAARHSHFVATRAESDYAALAGEVAATLNALVLAKDPKARLHMAVDARRRLASWPRDHYGYRAEDVREMLGLLDEAISGLRIAAGETSFALDLVADVPPAEDREERVPLLGVPSIPAQLAQAIAVANATDVAADRVSISSVVLAALDDPRHALPESLSARTREWAVRTLKDEAQVSREYASSASSLLQRAAAGAARADVRAVEGVLESVGKMDAQLGRRRPDEVAALVDQVRAHLDAARQLRLSRDRWRGQAGSYRTYTRAVTPIVDAMIRAQPTLDDIKQLAGSDAAELVAWGARVADALKALGALPVPEDLKPAHALLTSAVNLAGTAVKARREATMSGELARAWDASAAAAGSMALLLRARGELDSAVRLPGTR